MLTLACASKTGAPVVYYPFPGAEEFCAVLKLDPTIESKTATLINTIQQGVVQRALYKVPYFDKTYYLYTVKCDAKHFGDRTPLNEVHVTANLRDFQLAFQLEGGTEVPPLTPCQSGGDVETPHIAKTPQ